MRRIVQRAGRERDPVAAETADTIDLFVLALGAGLNLRLAVEAVARRGSEFGDVGRGGIRAGHRAGPGHDLDRRAEDRTSDTVFQRLQSRAPGV